LNSSSRFASDGNSGFEVVWEDGERVFRRGNSHGDDTTLVLAVQPAAEHRTPATLDRLAHEYGLKEELDGAWAARPLGLIREGGRTVLMLEDPGGEPLERLLGVPFEMDFFPRLAIDISVAVGRLHRRGLLHCHLGLTQAATTGKLVSDLVAGRRPPLDMEPYAISRFN
jgi:hypothetical protein